MPTVKQSFVANLTRLYPFYSGCGSFPNKPFFQKLVGSSNERVWSPVPGGEILAPLSDYVGRAAFYVGDLDRKITWICDQIVRPGDTVLDIGANLGIVTLWLSHLVGENGKVHAFEPNPELQKILQLMLNRNQVANVCLHPVALGPEECSLELRVPKINAGAASLIRNHDSSDCDVVQVPVRPLSEIVAEQNIDSIRLIKIDVEGFEAQVLQGGQQVLEKIRPDAILFELNERFEGSIGDQPVMKILRDCGYRFFSIPRCMLRMHLQSFDLDSSNELVGNDFLAVYGGENYESIAALVKAAP